MAAWLLAGRAHGTGFYGPDEYLSDGSRLTVTPEFYWDLEVNRLARDFHPKEQPDIVLRDAAIHESPVDRAPLEKATEDADAADFADAIKTGRLQAADPKAAESQHAAVRAVLQETGTGNQPLPAEPDSEFADYDRGAYAYRQGQDHWDEARKAWLALLDRPAPERHYRTVWAAFMLGKVAMKSGDPGAVQWYEKTRDLAAQGFADSLGMAADSYGWEGRSEWKQGHPAKAAPMFLTQLALGDDSAVVSLKALIPDRDDVEGMLNYGDESASPDANATPTPTAAQQAGTDRKIQAALAVMAADPLLRRLETAHVLATESGGEDFAAGTPSSVRSARWLGVIEAARLTRVEDAEYLGWVAYTTGNYRDAKHWLGMSAGTSPVAEWLRARLDLRAGDVKGAAASMAAAWTGLRDENAYVGLMGTNVYDDSSMYIYRGEGESEGGAFTMPQWASGDLGTVRLLRSDFVQALDTFLKGGLRSDAAYVAERVLTTDELKAYVDQMPPPPPPRDPDHPGDGPFYATDDRTWLRYLLGRRMVREDRYAEAGAYMPAAYGKLLSKYVEALKNGADAGLSKAVRADNWSTAAWLARYDGMELMGTEVWPDGFDSEGNFQDTDLVALRLSGTYQEYNSQGNPVALHAAYPAAKAEKDRIRQDPVRPDVRYHYRVIAAALALRAAALMEDNTEELADAMNTAGSWADDLDDKLANRCWAVIEDRCAKTKIGQDVIAKRWFAPDETGPWSKALQGQEDALHKEFGIAVQQ